MHKFAKMFLEHLKEFGDLKAVVKYEDNTVSLYLPSSSEEDEYLLYCVFDFDCSLIVYEYKKEPREFFNYKYFIEYFDRAILPFVV